MNADDQAEPEETEAKPKPPFGEAAVGPALVGADALDAVEATRLLAQQSGRVVVWAGERESGKTTLSAELYERQRRPGVAYYFAGSETLLAFEQRAHPARAASGRRVRETRRTERDPEGRELLHLALAEAGVPPINLLFADLPGEVFRDIRDNVTHPDEIPLLRRADKLAFVADGFRISDPKRRSLVVSGIRQIIDRLRAARLPHPETQLALVITMWDRVSGDEEAETYWTARERELLEEVRLLDPEAPLIRVAARAPLDWGHDDNMDALRAWILAPPRRGRAPKLRAVPAPPGALPKLVRPKRLTLP